MAERTHSTTRHPAWWTHKHSSAWERVKGAMERDWEQTKAHFSHGGHDLNQSIGDTVRQSTGSKPIPPLGVKTRPTDPKEAAKEAKKALEAMQKQTAKATEKISKVQDDFADTQVELSEKVGEARKDLASEEAKAGVKFAHKQAKAEEAIGYAESKGEGMASVLAKTEEGLAAARAKADKSIASAREEAGEDIADAREDAAKRRAKGQLKIEEAGAARDEAIAKWQDAEAEVRYGYSVRSQHPAAHWDDKLEGQLQGEWDALATGKSWGQARADIRRGWDHAGR